MINVGKLKGLVVMSESLNMGVYTHVYAEYHFYKDILQRRTARSSDKQVYVACPLFVAAVADTTYRNGHGKGGWNS